MAKNKGQPPLVELVIARTTTDEDVVEVFIEGEKVANPVIKLIDAGRGWRPEEWRQHYHVMVETPGLSPACREAVAAAFAVASPEFIEE